MTKCRACDTNIIEFFSLGQMPLANALLSKEQIIQEKRYKLAIGFCPNCYLVQLIETVDPKELFSTYLYFSSVTSSIVEHSKKTAEHLISKLKLNSKSLVVEIGSNDGVHLTFYKEKGIQVLGIDPAKNIVKESAKKSIKTLPEFFSYQLAENLSNQKIKADVIYGANVFAHMPNILDVIKGINILLNENGTAVFESPYIDGLLENKFDTIYHEHVFYYSLIALENLFKMVGMEIYDCEFVEMQGGSLRIFVGHTGKHKISDTIVKQEKYEFERKYDKIETYRTMEKNISTLRQELQDLLAKIKKSGQRIAVYGVPAKGVTLLNYFDITKYIDFIVDKSPAKRNKYVPGVHLLIYSPSKIIRENPEYVLILPWNISEEIIKDLDSYKKSGGKFIIPIPAIKVI